MRRLVLRVAIEMETLTILPTVWCVSAHPNRNDTTGDETPDEREEAEGHSIHLRHVA
jgi:hypothetical protein